MYIFIDSIDKMMEITIVEINSAIIFVTRNAKYLTEILETPPSQRDIHEDISTTLKMNKWE